MPLTDIQTPIGKKTVVIIYRVFTGMLPVVAAHQTTVMAAA